ncbi:MAG: hypothetical protein Q8K30_02995 [Candidatus Gracilibacteria bacterium]|nr:hypothetical protein [Candidatus Gracilibacteria bacterium]
MITIINIVEKEGIKSYLIKRNLIKQYKKAKIQILAGIYGGMDLKIREPKDKGIWSFRINKQYRAFCILEGDTLIVLKIDNHQNY